MNSYFICWNVTNMQKVSGVFEWYIYSMYSNTKEGIEFIEDQESMTFVFVLMSN